MRIEVWFETPVTNYGVDLLLLYYHPCFDTIPTFFSSITFEIDVPIQRTHVGVLGSSKGGTQLLLTFRNGSVLPPNIYK